MGEFEKEIKVNREWAKEFCAGQAVIHGRRRGHGVAVPKEVIEADMVPVMYDDESGAFVVVPANDPQKSRLILW